MIREKITSIILDFAGLDSSVIDVDYNMDLYEVGMKSFNSVQLLLALEDNFEIKFPECMLVRSTFRSAATIERAVRFLQASSPQ